MSNRKTRKDTVRYWDKIKRNCVLIDLIVDDIFGIDEITMYDGEWSDKVYAVAGDVLDGYLYDLLMNLLEEKGISNEFVEKIANFSTLYEHSRYINLLENLSKFTTGK